MDDSTKINISNNTSEELTNINDQQTTEKRAEEVDKTLSLKNEKDVETNVVRENYDEYAPYNYDEMSDKTKCGNKWSLQIYYTADKNIYTSNVYVGIEGTENYTEYPIIGNFKIPAGSQFQYITYADYQGQRIHCNFQAWP